MNTSVKLYFFKEHKIVKFILQGAVLFVTSKSDLWSS